MAEESKLLRPAGNEGDEDSGKAAAVSAGKQPAVESDDDSGDGTKGAQDSGKNAAVASSKKKSKRKRIKEAFGGKPSDVQGDIKNAINNLPPDQLAELLKLNPALAQEVQPEGSSSNPAAAIEALKKLSLQDIMTGLASKGKNAKDMASYKFWQTQPVPKFDDGAEAGTLEEGPIKEQKLEDVPKEPPKLIEGFEWDTLDLTDAEQLKEVYELLNGHYVEDEEAMFRFKYSPSILKW